MTRQPEYLRYLESAKQAEVAAQLRSEGFVVETEQMIGDARFDLIARKGARSIAYEFKSGPSKRTSRENLKYLQRIASERGLEFRIVVVNPPPRVHVEVDNLTSQLQEHLINEAFPDELDLLSTHTSVTGIADIEIGDIHVGQGKIRIAGTGSVEVQLQYGSSSDAGPSSSDAFPFSFRATLSPEGQLTSVEKLTVDTSTFYE